MFHSSVLAASSRPLFQAFTDAPEYHPSVSHLNPLLTINVQTVAPVFRFNGKDANGSGWAPWGYGSTLSLQAGTAPTYDFGSPLLGVDDSSVRFNNGGYFSNASSGVWDGLVIVGTAVVADLSPLLFLNDLLKHNLRVTWKTDKVESYSDGVANGPTDISAAVPPGMNTLTVGGNVTFSYNAYSQVISNLKIYPFPTIK